MVACGTVNDYQCGKGFESVKNQSMLSKRCPYSTWKSFGGALA